MKPLERLNAFVEKYDVKTPIQCPKCGSDDFIHTTVKNYSKTRGLAGTAILGPVGLVLGASKAKDVLICKKCSHEWRIQHGTYQSQNSAKEETA